MGVVTVVPRAVNTSGISVMGFACAFHTPTKKAKEGHDLLFSPDPSMEIIPYQTPDGGPDAVTDLVHRKRNLEREVLDFAARKASAKGWVKHWQNEREPLKLAVQATESEYLHYKDQLQTLDAKMGAKARLVVDIEKEIDIRNREIDHVNKRLRGLRR
jgi:hypothetical protein